MTRSERQLKATEQEMERHSQEAQEIWKKADEDDRETTPEEKSEVEGHLRAIETLKTKRDEFQEAINVEKSVREVATGIKSDDGDNDNTPIGVMLNNGLASITGIRETKSIGEQFVESKGYQEAIDRVKSSGGVPRNFSTGAVEVGLAGKGTLLEGTGDSPGTGGALAGPVPQMVPGVQEKMFQRLTVNDLLPQATTNSNTLRYVVEGTATSGAAGVAEGGDKPESTLALSTTDEPVRKIATSLTVSDEMLEDAAQTQGYINGRLSLFVKIEEERQLMSGSSGNEVPGITGRSGVNVYARGTVDDNAIALFKAMNGTRGSSFLEPSAIIMNPANWQTTRLSTDDNGQFYGGGPFLPPYGGAGMASPTGNQISGAFDSLWLKPVVVTTAVGAGTALVGAFDTAAQVFRRSGVTVEATNSHDDYFTKNLVAIRAEERLGLAVYRPNAFTLVTGLN